MKRSQWNERGSHRSQLKDADRISTVLLKAERLTLRIWVWVKGTTSVRQNCTGGFSSVHKGQGLVKMVGSRLSWLLQRTPVTGYLTLLSHYGHLVSEASWKPFSRQMGGRRMFLCRIKEDRIINTMCSIVDYSAPPSSFKPSTESQNWMLQASWTELKV